MKKQITLTAIRTDGTEVSIVRSFDNEQAAGNFAVCRVKVNGRRFNRISCAHEVLIHPDHPSETYRDLHAAILEVVDLAYTRYVKACERENLNAHDRHMWAIHGQPTGPI